MNILRVAWIWFVLAVGVGALAAPSTGVALGPSDALTVRPSPNPGVYGNILWAASARTPSDAWAVGVQATASSNDTLALHWNGGSWSAVPTPNPVAGCQDGDIYWNGNSLNGVAAVAADDAWAVGSECYSMNTLLEHWNGAAWSIVAGPSLARGDGYEEFASLYGVAAISSSDVWAVGYRGSEGMQPLIEHYNGVSWSVVPSARPARLLGGDSYLTAVSGSGTNDVWAVGNGGNSSFIEHWNGTSWSIVSSPQPAGTNTLNAVTAISPTNAWAVGAKRGSTGATVTFVVHWNGTTWSEVPSPNPRETADSTNVLRGVTAVSAGNVWAVGLYHNEQTNVHQRRTLVLHWNGTSWNIVRSATPGRSGELNAVAAVRNGPLFTSGLYSNYDVNIYDGHYTLPQTLAMHG